MFGSLKHTNFVIWIIVMLFTICNSPIYAHDVKNHELDTLLKSSLDELLDIKITAANKQSSTISETPASAIVITRKDIEKYGYTTLEEILSNVPGFYLIDSWECEGANFGVRGFWSNTWNRDIAILVNGIRQIDDFSGANALNLINVPVKAIDRIEIVRGPMSVMYGTGAFFGVINIITDRVRNSDKKTIVSSSYGSNNTYSIFGRAQDSNNNFSYAINTSYWHTDGINIPYSEVNDLVPGNSKSKMKDTRKYLEFSGTFDNISADFSYNETNTTKGFLFPMMDGYDGDHNFIASRFSLRYNKKLSDKLAFTASMLYNHFETEYDYDTGAAPDLWEFQTVKSSSITFEMNAFYSHSKTFKSTLGFELHSAFDVYTVYDLPYFGLSNVYEGIDDDEIITRALFYQGDYSVTDKLKLIGGIRLEQMLPYNLSKIMFQGLEEVDPDNHYYYMSISGSRRYDQDEIELIPRLALIYSFNKRNILKLLYGQAVNHPAYFINRDVVFYPQTPDIKTEKVSTYEINYMSVINRNFTVNISGFHSFFDHLITRSTGFYNDGTYYSNWDNSGGMAVKGFEFQMLFNPFKRFESDISFTIQDVEDDKNNREVSFAPDMLAYIKLFYNPVNNLSLGLSGYYVTSMISQWDPNVEDPANPDSPVIGRLGEKTDDYLNMGFNIAYNNFILERLKFNFRISNLLDSDIYYPTTTAHPWAVKGTKGLGRNFMVTLSYQF